MSGAFSQEVAAILNNIAGGRVHPGVLGVVGDPSTLSSQQFPTNTIDIAGAGVSLVEGAANTYVPAAAATGFTTIVAQLHATITGWLVRAPLHTPSAAGVFYAQVGLGAAKAERCVENLVVELVGIAGINNPANFAVPVRVPGAIRVGGRVGSVGGGVKTILMTLHVIWGFN